MLAKSNSRLREIIMTIPNILRQECNNGAVEAEQTPVSQIEIDLSATHEVRPGSAAVSYNVPEALIYVPFSVSSSDQEESGCKLRPNLESCDSTDNPPSRNGVLGSAALDKQLREQSGADPGGGEAECEFVSCPPCTRVAQSLNNDIAPFNVIASPRSPCIPTRVEAWHSLEDRRLQHGPQDWQKFQCPLCDKDVYPPDLYKNNLEHYSRVHWHPRRAVGGYVCFPCAMDHGQFRPTMTETLESSRSITRKGKPRTKGAIRRIKTGVPYHWHCPACKFLDESFDEVLVHARIHHKGSAVDPDRCVRAELLHTPIVDIEGEYTQGLRSGATLNGAQPCEPCCGITTIEPASCAQLLEIKSAASTQNATVSDSDAPPEITQPLSEGTSVGLHLSWKKHTPDVKNVKWVCDSSPVCGHPEIPAKPRPLKSCVVYGRQRKRSLRRVGFHKEVRVRPYDKELSLVEKIGAVIGKENLVGK
eukprot:GHVT01006218.1.p1 GENE.GHVT01006218.1~~GHVT01006218.1.p1  ORF type:complete len:475 (+),score=17.49 GHVT01006218.1:1319-2743(+)